MSAQFVVGIDLGTTNSVIAYADLESETPTIEVLLVPQLTAPGAVESLVSLPSFLYLATEDETGNNSFALPWNLGNDFAVGEWARRQSAAAPQRTIGAAKSWLAHSQVDRREPILPWNAPAEVAKLSPVLTSQRYLEHLVAVWHQAFPDAPLADQNVVLTVPASFDVVARELTREAALAAGLPSELVLLEEPQAAVYAWLDRQGEDWRTEVKPGDTLLVCDIGGGTTDFTLVDVTEEAGELVLLRRAVGNHLLVGGDNMDLAIAHQVSEALAAKGTKLDPWQSVALWHSCRTAKETLLATNGPETSTISVLGRGSKLVGGTVSIDVVRDEMASLLTEGFLPQCDIGERPARRRTSGFMEIGLPFETDTAITRHLAGFLGAHGETPDVSARPTHLLLNGGVFKSERLRQQLREIVGGWFADGPEIPELQSIADLEESVARGAARYAWSKHHGGVRIRGGTARTYYIGIETAGLAVPGAPRPLQALCVAAAGMEEGSEADVPSGEFGLVVGESAEFRFLSSTTRKSDQPGTMLASWTEDELRETDSLVAVLPADESIDDSYVPVRFHAKITELGVLELWCVSTKTRGEWKLEFSVRDTD